MQFAEGKIPTSFICFGISNVLDFAAVRSLEVV